jgi:uncharacterized protein
MEANSHKQILEQYSAVTLFERVFIHLRLMSCPFAELIYHIPSQGALLDVGCGFGLLPLLLVSKNPRRVVMGIDPDRRRIEMANLTTKKYPYLTFKNTSIEKLAALKKRTFPIITIIDVLYLLPEHEKEKMIQSARSLLSSNGQLFIKINDKSRTWRYLFTWLQEKLVVQLLKKTTAHDNGLYFENTMMMKKLLNKNQFTVTNVVQLRTPFPFYHAHWLITAVKA